MRYCVQCLMLILSTVVLASCATAPKVAQEISWKDVKSDIHPGSSLIYIVRPGNASGGGNTYKVDINGIKVADLKTGYYFSYEVPAGKTKIHASTEPTIFNIGLGLLLMGKPTLSITTAKGEIYFIDVGVGFAGGPTLTPLTPKLGQHLVEEADKINVSKK